MFYGLEGKFFGGSGISLTTLYVVLLSLGDTQYRHFVVRGTQKFWEKKRSLTSGLSLKLLRY